MKNTKLYLGLALFIIVLGLLFTYGQMRESEGVQKTIIEFQEADDKGVKTINEAVSKTKRSIGTAPDVDRLLNETNGFRD